ncbi:MAG: DUF4255 domain-containing protein [Ginsengibacter sp.]
MIDQVLKFIAKQMDGYLQVQQGKSTLILPGSPPYVILGNVSQIGTADSNNLNNHVIVSLINVEEDRISRPVNNYVKVNQQTGPRVVYKNPPVFLNLLVLFTAYYTDYSSSLQLLSSVVRFFQYKNVFNSVNAPDLPQKVDEIIFDLTTLSYQDLNNLWGVMGSKYLPSVVYKLRLIIISEDFAEGSAALLKEIIVNDKSIVGL